MATRVDTDMVISALHSKDYDGATDLTIHIRSANVVVNRVRACAVDKDTTLTDDELELMETWLACHFYVMTDQAYAEKETDAGSAGKARGKFQGLTRMNFQGTKYGQNALTVDPSGCLLAISEAHGNIGGFWGGKTPSEQMPYDDRS